VTRSPQHMEAMGRSTHHFGRNRKLVSAATTLGLTEVVIWAIGGDQSTAHLTAGVIALIGGVCAIVVGWGLLPGGSYIWSRLTYNGRTALSEIRSLKVSLFQLSAEEVEAEREITVATQAIREGLKQAEKRLEDCIVNDSKPQYSFNINEWNLHKDVFARSRPEIYDPVLEAMVALNHANDSCRLGDTIPMVSSPPFTTQIAKGLMKKVLLALSAIEVTQILDGLR
jgi:hypothetical protein